MDGTPNLVNVVRDNVLDGGFRAFKRKNFKPEARLSVCFIGEDGIDDGGLQREFATLALKEIQALLRAHWCYIVKVGIQKSWNNTLINLVTILYCRYIHVPFENQYILTYMYVYALTGINIRVSLWNLKVYLVLLVPPK